MNDLVPYRISDRQIKCTRRREVTSLLCLLLPLLFLFSSISILKCEKCQKIYWILFDYFLFVCIMRKHLNTLFVCVCLCVCAMLCGYVDA